MGGGEGAALLAPAPVGQPIVTRRPAGAFVLDQLGEPADLAVHRLQAVLAAARGCSGRAARRAATGRCFMPSRCSSTRRRRPSRICSRMSERVWREERQPGAETLVVEGVRADVGEQLGEVLLALGGQPVDPLAAPGPARRAGRVERRLLGDPARPRTAAAGSGRANRRRTPGTCRAGWPAACGARSRASGSR